MIVADFDIVGVSLFPTEADAPLVVDADGRLPGAIAGEFLKPIAGWIGKVTVFGCGVEHEKLAFGLAGKGAKLTGGDACGVELFRVFTGEGFDHGGTWCVSWIGQSVKWGMCTTLKLRLSIQKSHFNKLPKIVDLRSEECR